MTQRERVLTICFIGSNRKAYYKLRNGTSDINRNGSVSSIKYDFFKRLLTYCDVGVDGVLPSRWVHELASEFIDCGR